ncbi:hypothetical protein EBT31_11545 [bacterium]|nr:hypothetical protein [bacterium]NBX49748.1 hypothetical protein [bacterium]
MRDKGGEMLGGKHEYILFFSQHIFILCGPSCGIAKPYDGNVHFFLAAFFHANNPHDLALRA